MEEKAFGNYAEYLEYIKLFYGNMKTGRNRSGSFWKKMWYPSRKN